VSHTPGPWTFDYLYDHLLVSDEHGRAVADLGPGQADPPVDEQVANARLIAAAPELLEALDPDICLTCGEHHTERVLSRNQGDGRPIETSWASTEDGHAYRARRNFPTDWADIARAAIAKARGES
jgi:hypothetical protein